MTEHRQDTPPEPVEYCPDYSLGAKDAERLRETEEALRARPHVSLRLRIVTGFLLCFFLTGATALVTLTVLYQARSKLRFLESSQAVMREIEQARHFERDFFLNGTHLQEAQDHAGSALAQLKAETVNILDVAEAENLSALERRLGRYETLLGECRVAEPDDRPDGAVLEELSDKLDEESGGALELMSTLVSRETRALNRVLKTAQIIPFVFLVILLLIIFWMTDLLAKTITLSMSRFQGYLHRIAEGDFSLIEPAKSYHDEFSDLALAVNRMLSELRARERQVARASKLAALGTFISGIAHELNNPLNNVSITIEALMEECKAVEDRAKHRLLEDAYKESERANEIVRGLLDYTREPALEFRRVNLPEVIRSTCHLLENETALHQVTVDTDLPEDFPDVLGSFNQLRQVFLNLLLNAIQAMPEGGKISVSAHYQEGRKACVLVRDEGMGIPEEAMPHIFDPFYSTKERGKATGLGLSVSFSIIRKHHGDIRVESTVGEGTTFHICVPLADGDVNTEATAQP